MHTEYLSAASSIASVKYIIYLFILYIDLFRLVEYIVTCIVYITLFYGFNTLVFCNLHCIQLVCLFVCSFAIRATTTAQNATKLSGIIKWGSASVLHGLKLPVLQFLKRYPTIFGFSFAADGHFINYCSLDFRLSDGLIHCRSTIDFELGRGYSRYLPLLLAHIRQNWLGSTRCCATSHGRSPPKAGTLLSDSTVVLSM